MNHDRDPVGAAMTPKGFTECPECEGGLEYPTPSFSESHPLPVPCPSCSGVGVVPDPETVEACAEPIHNKTPKCYEPWGNEDEGCMCLKKARAALLAYAQHAKETK